MERVRVWLSFGFACSILLLVPGRTYAAPADEAKAPAEPGSAPAVAAEPALAPAAQKPAAAEPSLNAQEPPRAAAEPAKAVEPPPALTLQVDKTSLENGGSVAITGTAPAGRPVYLEVWSEEKVRAGRFDAEVDKATGARPYILYLTEDVPAYYRLIVPKEKAEALEKIKREGSKWSFSQALKDLGADAAYAAPASAKIQRFQATLLGSVIGSRGDLLPEMDAAESRKRSMQLMKAKFRSPGKIMSAELEVLPDGVFKATLKLSSGLAPGKYTVVAALDKKTRSQPVILENAIAFPHVYLSNAGASINLFWPFLLAFAISIFGVMMGAGGGFILNPLLVSLWPLPHTVVAGTVMPTVLFSQASGIANYSKIKFISWKLGVAVGLATIAGGFLGPKLTELVTLDQYKYVFGVILLVLAGLMFWQTTSGYLAKNKKEQAILKEFKKRAEDAAKAAEPPAKRDAA